MSEEGLSTSEKFSDTDDDILELGDRRSKPREGTDEFVSLVGRARFFFFRVVADGFDDFDLELAGVGSLGLLFSSSTAKLLACFFRGDVGLLLRGGELGQATRGDCCGPRGEEGRRGETV